MLFCGPQWEGLIPPRENRAPLTEFPLRYRSCLSDTYLVLKEQNMMRWYCYHSIVSAIRVLLSPFLWKLPCLIPSRFPQTAIFNTPLRLSFTIFTMAWGWVKSILSPSRFVFCFFHQSYAPCMHMHPGCLQHTRPIITITPWATRFKFQIGPTLTGFLEQSDDAHRHVYGAQKHEGHVTHELIAGAASFLEWRPGRTTSARRVRNLHAQSPCILKPFRGD